MISFLKQLAASLMVILLSGTPLLAQIPPEFISPPPSYTPANLPNSNLLAVLARVTDEKGRMGNGTGWLEIKPDRAIIRGGDLLEVADANMTAESCNLTSAAAAFAPTDVGKYIDVKGADIAGAILQTTIASYVNSTEVTTTSCAMVTVVNAKMQFFTDLGPIAGAAAIAHPLVIIERTSRPYGLATDIDMVANSTLVIRGDLRASWQNWGTQAGGDGAQLIDIRSISNVNIVFEGGSLDGQSHENETGILFGIQIFDGNKVNITGRGKIMEMPGQDATGINGGDAIIITGTATGCDTYDIYIGDGLLIDSNVRQGISVICAKQLRIHATTISNTSGTNPGSGIDFEPNVAAQEILDAVITASSFMGNAGGGVIVGSGATTISKDVRLIGNYFENNGRGDVTLRGFSEGTMVKDNHFRCSGQCMLIVDTLNPIVTGNIFEKYTGARASAGIKMYATGGTMVNTKINDNTFKNLDGYAFLLDMTALGSGTIDGLEFHNNRAQDLAGDARTDPVFWFRGDNSSTLKGVTIRNNACKDSRINGNEADYCVIWQPSGGVDETGMSAMLNTSTGTAGGRTVVNLANVTFDTKAGITADVTQTQGRQPLTARYNVLSVVSNTNDTVTAPVAEVGTQFSVINNGANTARIFPASGDDLGAGVDTPVTLAAGSSVMYLCYDRTHCREL